jgi:hypothetical protein
MPDLRLGVEKLQKLTPPFLDAVSVKPVSGSDHPGRGRRCHYVPASIGTCSKN